MEKEKLTSYSQLKSYARLWMCKHACVDFNENIKDELLPGS